MHYQRYYEKRVCKPFAQALTTIIKRAQNVGRKCIKREYVVEYYTNSKLLMVHSYTT